MSRPSDMKKLAILGSTGSIGNSALALVDLFPERFQVASLAAGSNMDALYQQSVRYQPSVVALADPAAAQALAGRLPGVRVLGGMEGVIEAAVHPAVDIVIAGITGAAGLLPTFHALREGKAVALANKETLVMAGELIMPIVWNSGLTLLPLDSEHCAIHQCLRGAAPEEVHRLVLTASGGPFLRRSKQSMEEVTVEEALNHPTWQMGPKITIDSATLMNKGLEVIEAHHLFGVRSEQISIVIHPQSVVHSMVEMVDGTVLAQMSITDMRSSILYALTYPERWESNLPRLDLHTLPALEFEQPDTDRFPSVRLAYQSLERGQTFPATLNAANEVAVECFLKKALPFSAISEVIEDVLDRHVPSAVTDLEVVLEADRQARQMAQQAISARSLI